MVFVAPIFGVEPREGIVIAKAPQNDRPPGDEVPIPLTTGELVAGFDLDQPFGFDAFTRALDRLRSAEEIEVGDVVNTGDRAERSAGLCGEVFAANIFHCVVCQGLGGVAALLRAVMHQAVLADIKIPGSGAATPIAGAAIGDGILEKAEPREMPLLHTFHGAINGALAVAERPKLAVGIVDDSDRR